MLTPKAEMRSEATASGVISSDWLGTLFIVACSAQKNPLLVERAMPAQEAYHGQGFKIAKKILESKRMKWCIFSGWYGFLWPTTIIENYDYKYNPGDRRPWGGEFDWITQRQYVKLMTADRIIVVGSRMYADRISDVLARDVESPFSGLPIGKMLNALKSENWINFPNA